MKKIIIVAILATLSVNAFAQKGMVKLDGCFDGQCSNLNFGMDDDDAAGVSASETETMSYALNYAHDFGKFGAGITYASSTKETDGKVAAAGDESTTIVVSGYWNKAGHWNDSCFAAVHYSMGTTEASDGSNDGYETTTIGLEWGHRYTLGKLAKLNWNWVPSVSYNMSTKELDAGGDDQETTEVVINVANFAVTF
jgi:predicted porin